jgi:uncharacterized protein (DUF1501 family)
MTLIVCTKLAEVFAQPSVKFKYVLSRALAQLASAVVTSLTKILVGASAQLSVAAGDKSGSYAYCIVALECLI